MIEVEGGATPTPDLSVVVPCYNAAPYFERCVQSVLAQDAALEVVLVDDGSSDGTLALARRLADEDGRVRVIARNHAGVVATRTAGVRAARAGVVALPDADDWVEPRCYDRLLGALDNAPGADGRSATWQLTAALARSSPRTSSNLACTRESNCAPRSCLAISRTGGSVAVRNGLAA